MPSTAMPRSSRISLTQTAATGFAEGQAEFTAGPQGRPQPPTPPCRPRPPRAAAPVHDDALRAALEALAQNILTRRKSKEGKMTMTHMLNRRACWPWPLALPPMALAWAQDASDAPGRPRGYRILASAHPTPRSRSSNMPVFTCPHCAHFHAEVYPQAEGRLHRHRQGAV